MVVASSLGRSVGPATFCTTTYSQGEFEMVAWDYCWKWGLVKRSPFLSEGLFQTDLFFLFVKNKYNCCGCHVVTQVWIVRVRILERVPEAFTRLFAKIQPQPRTSSSCVLYVFRLSSILFVLHLSWFWQDYFFDTLEHRGSLRLQACSIWCLVVVDTLPLLCTPGLSHREWAERMLRMRCNWAIRCPD